MSMMLGNDDWLVDDGGDVGYNDDHESACWSWGSSKDEASEDDGTMKHFTD